MMNSMQKQKAVVLRYSESFPQCNHTNGCAHRRLKNITVKHVLITEYYASIEHAQFKFLAQIC